MLGYEKVKKLRSTYRVSGFVYFQKETTTDKKENPFLTLIHCSHKI